MKTLQVTIVEQGSSLERRFTGFPLSVGRHPSNDVTLPDERVSRFHAELDVEGNDVVVRDRGTTNGTFVLSDTDVGRTRKASFRQEREVEFAIEGFYFRATLSEMPIPALTAAFLGTSWDIANHLLAAAGHRPHCDESLAHFEYVHLTTENLRQAQSSLRSALARNASPGLATDATDNVEAYLSATIAVLRSLQNSLHVIRRKGLLPSPEGQILDAAPKPVAFSESQTRITVPDVAPRECT